MATIEEVSAESQAIISKLVQQRDAATNEIAQLFGGLALKDLEIKTLKAEIEALKLSPPTLEEAPNAD